MESLLSTKPFAMRNFTLSFISLLFNMISTPLAAQSFASTLDMAVLLTSDSTAKSVLISDLLSNKPGGLSPIIGSGAWVDNGRLVQCRSLLAFNYGTLPKMIRPDMITKAQLVLMPLRVQGQADENQSQVQRLTVRRVLQPWEDSAVTWENQPATNKADEVRVRIQPKKKDQPLMINVTEMVRKMFRLGNNGFMLAYGDSIKTAAGSSHWFASTKYQYVNDRPLLLISYFIENGPGNKQAIAPFPDLPLTANDRKELFDMYVKPGPEIVTPPAPIKVTGNPPNKDK